MGEQRVFILNARDERSGHNFTGYGFWPECASYQDLSLSELQIEDTGNVARLFRAVHDRARAEGFATGYPTFHESGESYSKRVGVVFLRPEILEISLVSGEELGIQEQEPPMRKLFAARDWARNQGREHGFPTFHVREERGRALHEVVHFSKAALSGVWRRFQAPRTLDAGDSLARTFWLVHKGATERGFVGAIPNFWGNDEFSDVGQAEWNLNELLKQGWRIKSVEALGHISPSGSDGDPAHYLTGLIILERS